MRKLDSDSVLSFDDETVEILCECGNSITLVANDEDSCIECDTRYYTKHSVSVWVLEDGEGPEDLEEEE